VPRFALQRLVENALKHNEDAVGRSLQVTVSVQAEGTLARLSVADDGAGFRDAQPMGIGLENLRRSLDLLHDSRARLETGNRPGGGAEVVILLPLEAGHG
jgi:LytS/YehU family sensor histidine kinase